MEVCVNGTYLPISLDNGRFSVREATVICKQLGLGNGKTRLPKPKPYINIITYWHSDVLHQSQCVYPCNCFTCMNCDYGVNDFCTKYNCS